MTAAAFHFDQFVPLDPEDKRKHLEFIQAAITRMANASASVKSWLLPVVSLTYGYALTKQVGSVALLGISAVAIFALLDANYLNQERSFRVLYDRVAGGQAVPLFTMNPDYATPHPLSLKPRPKRSGRALRQWCPGAGVWLSWAIAPFYGPLVILGSVIFVRVG